MKKMCKSVLSLMLALIVVLGVVSPVVSAADDLYFKEHRGNSDMWLVDANSKNTASTIYLYGRADYICLKLKKEKGYYASFYFKMYSDSKYKKEVASYSTGSTSGTNYVTLPISFDDLKSGTYYVKTYVYKETFRSNYYYNETSIDPTTERTYKIVINKKGTDVDDMNTVMYGYENTEKGPRVYWYSVPGATGYYLYRKSPKTGKYTKIKTVKDSGDKFTGYTDSTYKGKNATRYYKVVAYKGSLKTPMSLKALKVRALKTPTVKAETISNNRIKVSWSKVNSNASYTVFYRHNDSDTWKEVKTVNKKLSCVVDANKYESNETYRFTVVATVGGVNSGYKIKGTGVRFLEYPELEECTYPEEGGITVNWTRVYGADGYRIYRKTKNGGKWKELCDVTGGKTNSYTDTTANDVDMYYYTVRSMRKDKLGSYSNSGVKGTILTKPVLLEITNLDGRNIRCSWEKLPNECEYDVLKKTSTGWENFATTTEAFFDYELPLEIGSHTFTVKAVRDYFVSDFDTDGLTYDAYPQVAVTLVEASSKGLKLEWEKPENAGNSVVYKKTGDGEYTLLTEIEGCSFIDTDTETGVDYIYKIAYKYNDEVIESAAVEQRVCIYTDTVERADINYKTSGETYKKFRFRIKDFDAESDYLVYWKTEEGWVKIKSSTDSVGRVTVGANGFGDNEEFALVKISPNGDCTLLPENGFIVIFNSGYITSATAVQNVDKLVLNWEVDCAYSADNVMIYRKAEDEKKYVLIGTVPANETTFVDTTAIANDNYYYQLRTETDNFISANSTELSVNFMGVPELKYYNAKDSLQVYWYPVSNAEKYIIYRKMPGDEKWTKVATRQVASYHDKKAESFVEYMYKVKAIDNNGNVSWSTDTPPIFVFVPKTTSFKVSMKTGYNKLSWDRVEGATGYIITYTDTKFSNGAKVGDGGTIKIKKGTTTSYIDETAPSDGIKRTYSFRVVYKDYKSAESSREVGRLKQPKVTSFKKTKSYVRVYFTSVSGASEYEIFRKAPGEKNWEYIQTVYNTRTFFDSNVTKGQTYYYTVRACSGKFKSNYNKNGWPVTF